MGTEWILVTGGGRGIGKAVSMECARHGYNLAITFNSGEAQAESTAKEIRTLGVDCKVFRMSAEDTENQKKFSDGFISTGIMLSGLVNNAGIYRGERLHETSDESWEEVISVNLSTPFRIIRDLGPAIKQGGSIVNVASVYGLKGDPWGYAYQASKAALIHLTRGLAKEFAPGIRVNCVAPGYIRTDINAAGREDEKFRSLVEKRTPLNRWGEVEDIAAAVYFLLSSSSSFVTGHTLLVDGGISL